MDDERAFLDTVAASYTRASRQDAVIRRLIVRMFAPYLDRSCRGLQLGYAEGVDTRELCGLVASLDVVEGSRAFLEAGRAAGLPNVTFHEALFETFAPPAEMPPYDCVFAVYVLEHVAEPGPVLAMARRVLAPVGRLFVVVPNARALSRQLARHMGLIENLDSLTEHDHAHGHRRVYDRVSLNRDLEAAGFRTVAEGGIFLKILADFQLDKLYADGVLGESQIEGLYRLGLEYPDLCGSLFSICETAGEARP